VGVVMEYEEKKQVFANNCRLRQIDSMEILNHTQLVISFVDGTHLTVTARLSDGKPWVGTRVLTGAIEKEWREEDV
jgi:hypothetical protein